MTIKEVVAQIQATKPSVFGVPDFVRWLNELDGQLKREVIDTHEGGRCFWRPYEPEDMEQELLVKPPYDGLYVHYLASKIDYANAEYGKFNNTNAMFATALADWRNAYNRTHMPKRGKTIYF